MKDSKSRLASEVQALFFHRVVAFLLYSHSNETLGTLYVFNCSPNFERLKTFHQLRYVYIDRRESHDPSVFLLFL